MSSPVVIYAAKSTEDKHGSIPTQIEDRRALAEREGWAVVGEFTDEGFSAYKGNRGPGLAQAKEALAQHAPCVLVVQHTDRLARGAGDEPGAADHLMELFFWLGRQGIELWAVQSGKVDRIRALLEGERNTEDSKRKSAATRDGLRRRKERGQPVGPIPLGYTVERAIIEGQVVTSRVIDPATAPAVERIFAMVENGLSFGAVNRLLNAEGVLTKRDGTWLPRTVREIVLNEAYAGRRGYPAIIEPGRWQAIQDSVRRPDPAALQRRKGGRKPTDPSYWLRGTVFCLDCGAALYTRLQAAGRVYVCSNRRQSTGLCHADPIPASLIEGHVLDHLEAFVGDAEAWLAQQAEERDDDRQQLLQAAQRLRDDRDRIDRRRELVLADYEAAVAEGDPTARMALKVADRLDTESETMHAKIADAESVAAEWEDVDDSGLEGSVDLIRALSGADTAQALNAALSRALAGIYARVSGGRLRAEFELAPPHGRPADRSALVHLRQASENLTIRMRAAHALTRQPVEPVGLEDERFTLRETVRHTFV